MSTELPYGTFPWALRALYKGERVRRELWAEDVSIGFYKPEKSYGEEGLYIYHWGVSKGVRYQFGFKQDLFAKDWSVVV